MVGEDFFRILVKKGKAGDGVRAKHSASIQWTQPLHSKSKLDTIRRREEKKHKGEMGGERGKERERLLRKPNQFSTVSPLVPDCRDS